ncbi:phenylalanine-tRNA ligase [Mycena olivaceomarginata]|nr:phenylalanine-tRNA ligase [Mycena olivaceomarginata]
MAEGLQQLILDTLHADSTIPDTRLLVIPGQSEPAASQDAQIIILGALNSLLSRDMVKFETHETLSQVLTPEGSQIAVDGAPVTLVQLKKQVGNETAIVGQRRAFKNGWIGKEGNGLVKLLSTIKDLMQLDLLEIQSSGSLKSGEKDLADLRKRKLIAQRKGQWFTVQKGSDFSTSTAKPETDLTVDMLTSGAWKTSICKKYNFEAEGAPTGGGSLHPLLKVREEIRNNFLEMGFAEMPTASFVESSFWCFDALFGPSNILLETCKTPSMSLVNPPHSLHPESEYYKRVSTVHEHRGFGSMGYRAPWSHEETTKLLLRTHTTASSAHMLYKLAARCRGEDLENDRPVAGKEGPKDDSFRPAELFSIDRIFRNETTDATHLAEFHQVEGVVADRGLTLADLIGFMKVFFNKMGIEQVRFKPAYNPYTWKTPSLEIFAFHPMLDRWVEVGNSVHGWGLGLERPTMIRFTSIEGIENSPAPML